MFPLSNRIKAIRKALNLSQREFGEKLGVSRDVISNIEYNRVPPKELLLRHICELYYVNEDWLYTGTGEMFHDPFDETSKCDEVLKIFRSLRPDFQDCAFNQIKQLAKLQNNFEK